MYIFLAEALFLRPLRPELFREGGVVSGLSSCPLMASVFLKRLFAFACQEREKWAVT